MMTDPIADMLTRIRNALTAKHERVDIPLSKLKVHLAEILKAEGYIEDFAVQKERPGTLSLRLKYGRDRESAILGLKRASRPGRRLYVGHRDIPKVLNGMGISIISTSRGLLTDRDARHQHIGGEVLCEVW
ncbi:MAG: 30S ribosomal protein S8 [Myxococcales bacterium]|nr:30S ribosomal protein S8 [Myxococcales bacterium]MDD9966087.1 30S ribosomal protein S8 [Myxococcales bacterium]